MLRRRTAMALVVAIASVLVACGGDDDDDVDIAQPAQETADDTSDGTESRDEDDAAAAGDDCVLVDTASVTEAMGQEMVLVLSYAEGCEWRATADSAIQTFVTKITEDEYNVDGAEPLDGIGDEAYIRRGMATRTVYFRIGSDRFSVEAGDLNRPDSYEEAMIAIATAVAASVD